MEQITRALLSSALTTICEPSQRQLPDAECQVLWLLVTQMATRYPSQDLTDSIEGIAHDLEQLCLKYSLRKVQRALEALRIKPGQRFFPRPDEVAEEIEAERERDNYRADIQLNAELRKAEIAKFWVWVKERVEYFDETEESLLERWPSYRGTKLRG